MIYLDNAATTFPKPSKVTEEMMYFMKTKGGNPGRGGHILSMEAFNAVYSCREKIAELINTTPEKIILTPSATFALNLAIKGVLKHSDQAIITDNAHNSMLRPLHKTCNYSICSSVEHAKNLITSDTKMILLNHASNLTGEVEDLESYKKLCKEEGLLLLVDASQSLGHIKIDAEGIDMLTCAGHKALYGPQGTGFLYVSENVEIFPITEGGTGIMSENFEQPAVIPEGFESGTLNSVGFWGLRWGIEYVLKSDFKGEREIAKYIKKELSEIPKIKIYGNNCDMRVPVISFNIEGLDCVCVSEILSEKYGICVRSGLHCAPLAHKKTGTLESGAIRVSLSNFTTMQEAQKFLNAVDRTAYFGV